MPRDLCSPAVGKLPSSRTFTPAAMWAQHSEHNPHSPIFSWSQNAVLPTQCSQSKEAPTWYNAFERCLFCTFTVGTWKNKCWLMCTSGLEDRTLPLGVFLFFPFLQIPCLPLKPTSSLPSLWLFQTISLWCGVTPFSFSVTSILRTKIIHFATVTLS